MHLTHPARLVARGLTALVPLFAATAVTAQTLKVSPDHADAIYKAGERAVWTVAVESTTTVAQVKYSVKFGGATERTKGDAACEAGQAVIEAGLDKPGTLLLEVSIPGPTGTLIRAQSGAVFSPESIEPSAPRPDDFDAFWQSKLDELALVPPNPELAVADGGRTNVAYWQVTLDNIRGTHIRGQLARPLVGEKLPAMLIVQWAGVYPLQKGWVSDRAAEGWLAMNINAHDLPIDQPAEFYTAQADGPLKDYAAIGNDDRDTSYFLRMYLSCYRAAEYLTQRPDWDGRTLVVTGGSQGGLQTLMLAGFHPKVTAAVANVPAGCDMTGSDVGRLPGWPQWCRKVTGKDAAQVRTASRYYDVVNFAPRVKCPVLIGVGLIDTTCPPAGVYAAYNLMTGPKEIILMPRSGHGQKDNSQAAFYARNGAWMNSLLRTGQPPAVATPVE